MHGIFSKLRNQNAIDSPTPSIDDRYAARSRADYTSSSTGQSMLASFTSTNKKELVYAKPNPTNTSNSSNTSSKPKKSYTTNMEQTKTSDATSKKETFTNIFTSSKESSKKLDLKADDSLMKIENKEKSLEVELEIFDPEPAFEEQHTFNYITYIDDRSFIDDDSNVEDEEVAEIHQQRIKELVKGNNCYTVNEVPEGRLSKLSSRASSRSSLGSDSTRGSGIFFGEQTEQQVVSFSNSETSASDSGIKSGSKNTLLDALVRKFNLSASEGEAISEAKTVPLTRHKYFGEDQKKKQSELQRKINRNNLEKNRNNLDLDDEDAKSSKSSGTKIMHNFVKKPKSVIVTKLPQSFECKYLGKTSCLGLWGLKHIREPVDRLVRSAKRLKSLDELPSVEALLSEKGIYIVERVSNKNQDLKNKNPSDKHYRSGLLPICNISYAVQDNLYGKVFSCIVVRERDEKTISECYSFLCKKNEVARKMALSITLAFKEYGKMLQLNETNINRNVKVEVKNPNEPSSDSFA